MAAPLNQDEIDALLGSTESLDEGGTETSDATSKEEAHHHSGPKYFGTPETTPFRFKYVYRSPVLKNTDYVFNPPADDSINPDKKVVRTLSHYARYLKNLQ